MRIAKLGNVSFKNRNFPKWWNQILFEITHRTYKVENRKDAIGLDFSPSEIYVSSENQTGKDFGYIAQKQAHSKQLRKLQRRLARKQKGSKNREKARIKLARLEEHIANSRRDWIEKETLRLVRSYDRVVVEDLNLIGISKFLRNAKNMTDTSYRTFVSRLESKGRDYDYKIIKADRYFPSSQLCSNCGSHHIRDVNAAINLKNYISWEARKLTPVESDKISSLSELALQEDTLEEAGSHTGDKWQEYA